MNAQNIFIFIWSRGDLIEPRPENFNLSKNCILCLGKRDGEKHNSHRSVEIVWNHSCESLKVEKI